MCNGGNHIVVSTHFCVKDYIKMRDKFCITSTARKALVKVACSAKSMKLIKHICESHA